MKSARVVILVLTGLLFTGCYTQLQMSKSAGKKGGGTTQKYQTDNHFYLSGYQYLGYSNRWGNFYYSPLNSYFGWYNRYGYDPYAYSFYRFNNTSGYFFASGGQEQAHSNYGPRVIGANRVGDNTKSVERDRDDNNGSRVRSRATADDDQTKTSRSRSSAERSDENNRRLMNQIRLARGLESVREDLSTNDLPRVELDTWNVDKEIERKFGKDLSAYIKTNRSDFYHRLKGYFKRENNRVRSSDVYRGSDFESSPRSTSTSVRSRSTVTRSSSGDSRSRSSSSSSSRSRNNSGDSSSGSERSRGNN